MPVIWLENNNALTVITLDKLKIYNKYGGDGDLWIRSATIEEKLLTGNDWYLIDSLLQDLVIVKNGSASQAYIIDLDKKLIANFDNSETIDFLKILIK